MNRLTAVTLMIGFIVMITLSSFSPDEFRVPLESQTSEIVYDTEKLESETSDEAIKVVDADLGDFESLISLYDHSIYDSSQSLQQIFRPPKTSFFS